MDARFWVTGDKTCKLPWFVAAVELIHPPLGLETGDPVAAEEV